MNGHHVGGVVMSVADRIERPTGTVPRGKRGRILSKMAGGYRVDFGNGLIVDNVPPDQIRAVE
jgi:hypothetical protein